MASSEEYLASIGFDTSDVDRAVSQTITLLGRLADQFDGLQRPAERAQRAFGKTAEGARESTQAMKDGATAARGWAQSMAQVNKSTLTTPQSNIYDQYMREQRAFDTQRGEIAAQNRQSLVTQEADERRMRQNELNGLRESIQSRYAHSDAMQEEEGNLARLRYAVYDVSNALRVGGIAALAFTVGIVGSAVAFERQFADVRRTTGLLGEDADQLFGKFVQISTEIPVAFSALAEIGTLAGQLGIAEDRVASFTETTAKFAATTDVTVAASATAFGRLDELIAGVDGRYENLASSILAVGISSVSTESQIIAISSQIAATGDQAGLTADEIIGLSSALASLGIAPEAARGTVLRVFSQINKSVAEGGEALNDFAAISGMSAAEFEKGWGSDFTTTFLAFLNGLQNSTSGAETAMRALGITATRDVNAILKLAQNTDLLADQLQIASNGFSSATLLSENFGIIAETNGARLQILVQTVQAFAATVGAASSGPLSAFLDYLQRVLEAMIAFSSTPFGQGVSLFATVLGAVLAVLLLTTAAALNTAGSFLALKTAIGETYLQTMLARGGMQGFTASLFGAAGASRALAAGLKATGVGLLVTGGLYLLGEAVAFLSNQFTSAEQKAEAYFGSLEGLSSAIREDNTAVFATQIEAVNGQIDQSVEKSDSWIDALREAAAAQDALKEATADGEGAIDAQTLSIGENTQQWLRNALAQSAAFQEIFTNLDQLDKLTGSDTFSAGGMSVDYQAFDLTEYINIAATQGSGAAVAFYDSWIDGLYEAFYAAGAGTGSAQVLIEEALGGTDTLNKVRDAGIQIGETVTLGLEEAASGSAQNAFLDALLGPLEEGTESASDSFRTLIDDVYGVINAQRELSEATQALGADFAENGAVVASSGSAMQQVISSIYASSSGAPEAAARMQGLFNALVAGGYASAAQLAPLQAIIASLAGGKQVQAVAFDMTKFAGGIDKVAKSAGGRGGGAAKAVRTLVDYANDLSKVFDRAFDIRFGSAEGLDSITSGWRSIQDATAKANTEIAKYQQTMMELAADRQVLEYFLSVAEAYGDSLRAGQLRAEIADIDNKLASTAGNLADAQGEASKTLTGNSDAAIANRAKIIDLVATYQDYLKSLASSGLSQEELQRKTAQLKADFIAQATQLGYNSGELGIYAAAFDDVALAVARVPRNITVTANTNPAIQALNEYQAALNSARGNAARGFPDPIGDSSGTRQRALMAQINARAAFVQQLINSRNFSGADSAATSLAGLRERLRLGQYRSGTTWTGSGNPWDIAGVVHNREAVLNERGTQAVPSQFIQAANQGRNPWQYAPQMSSSGDSSMGGLVELGPQTMRSLKTSLAREVALYVDSREIARASADGAKQIRQQGGSL